MLSWIRSWRRLRAGDRVQVRSGPYAGKDGLVVSVAPDERLHVYIDDCCQPVLGAGELRRRGRARADVAKAIRDAKLADTDGELARAGSHTRDIWNGLAGPR